MKNQKVFWIIVLISMEIFSLSCKKTYEIDPFDINCPKYIFTPRNFYATQEGASIKLTWVQPVKDISGFILERKKGQENWLKTVTLEKDISSWIDHDIEGEEFYEYSLYAYAGNNKSITVYIQITPVFDFFVPVLNDTIEIVGIVGGSFYMGIPLNGQHIVTLCSYYIGKTEVTQSLWSKIMGNNPSYFKGNEHRPVETVNWFEIQEFITKLNKLTSSNFRLSTEAEWEYAAGGGSQNRTVYGGTSSEGSLIDYAWYYKNSGILNSNDPNYGSHPVKQKYPNSLGIYDMSGNVKEWVQDWYEHYNILSKLNPTGPESGTDKINRGGGWCGDWFNWDNYYTCKVSERSVATPDFKKFNLGFRLAHSIRR
jgi:formylglycine-generating enzyme required for sulfatase activity